MKAFICAGSVLFSALFMFGCNDRIYSTHSITQLPKDEYLRMMAADTHAYVIDVRTKFEYNREHLPRARSLSLVGSNFDERIELLDTTKAVFIYCETAHRSPFATMKLKRVGFTRIYDLKGGYSTIRVSQ